MQRRQDRHKRGPVFRFMRGFVNFFRSYRKWSNKGFVAILLLAVALSMGLVLLFESFQGIPLTSQKKDAISKEANKTNQKSKDQEEQVLVLWPMEIYFTMILSICQLKRKMAAMIFMRILNT